MIWRLSYRSPYPRRDNVETLNLVLILLAALVNLITAYIVIQLRTIISETAQNVLKVELATNSMKDELVKAVARANLSEGREQGRDRAELKDQRIEPKSRLAKEVPLPVADDRTAKAAEKTADATKQIAVATERMADDAKEASDKGTKK